jgi:hypothetical protein
LGFLRREDVSCERQRRCGAAPADTSVTLYALIGHERNGVFC